MIQFNHVFIRYVSEFYSLYNFSCEINSNTLFVGDFFSGTTAIMRTLSKIDKDYKGEIFIDNVNLKNIKDKDLNLVYLPENPVLFKSKNLFKNLYFPLKIRKINKKTAKTFVFNSFFELKKGNFNFLENYLNIQDKKFTNNENLKNRDLQSLIIENIMKLKVKKSSLSEQKIITLIRAVLRKPKYILLENFFKNLDEKHTPIAKFLINQLKASSIIIACENQMKEEFENFDIINLADKKKED